MNPPNDAALNPIRALGSGPGATEGNALALWPSQVIKEDVVRGFWFELIDGEGKPVEGMCLLLLVCQRVETGNS